MYTINHLVEFNPDNQSLVNRHTGKKVLLQVPATYCLLYLITHQGVISSQNDLMRVGWGKRNEVTTPNSFYQTILTLRNALTDVGLPRDTIKTIARRGLMLGDGVYVKEIVSAVNVSGPKTGDMMSDENRRKQRPSLRRITYVSVFGFILFVLAWVGYLSRPDPPFKNYVSVSLPLALKKPCHLFSSVNEISFSYYFKFLHDYPELCTNNYYVFVNGYRQAQRIVAFVCNNDPRTVEEAICSTHYYWQREQ